MSKAIDMKTSYTAADSIPLKVLLDKELIRQAEDKSRLLPIHLQFLPTNKCNLECSFCSCSERDKKEEIDFELAKKIIDKCKGLGTKSVTITGGGEPLLYKRFDELIDYFVGKEIKIGLVSNGLLLHKSAPKILNKITWCRISNDDYRDFTSEYSERLSEVVRNTPDVDWAFSHVVSEKPNHDEILKIIDFANKHDFTHVRLVSDLFNPAEIDMDALRHFMKKRKIDDRRVIYQARKTYTEGGDCYVGYVKPLIGANAKVYACCGVQYALKTPSRDLPEELCLGDAIQIDRIIENSNNPLDGSICVKCYYMNYNTILKGLVQGVKHKEFI